MKNLNLLPCATFMILLSFANSGFRLIADVFKFGIMDKIGVISIVGALVIFFILFLVGQNDKVFEKVKERSN